MGRGVCRGVAPGLDHATARRGRLHVGRFPHRSTVPGLFHGPNGEFLYRVAQKHFACASRWNEIAALNREVLNDPNALRQGVELKLPNDAAGFAW